MKDNNAGGGADISAIRFDNIPQNIIISGGNGSSIQPEEWVERFRKVYYEDLEKDGIVAIDVTCTKVESFLKDEIRKAEEKTLKEVFEKIRSVESYCIQPSGYCNEEQEKEIYLNGFDDMRAYKIINVIGYAKEKAIKLEALKK
jgi:hypothetical protein